MLISLNWLKDFVEVPEGTDPKELGQQLTIKTAEVEKVTDEASKFHNMVAGKVVKLEKHPDADRLQVAQVDVGDKEPLQFVCGGANLKEGMHVAITKVGSQVRWHGEGGLITLKKAKVRGVESNGMIAAAVEIGIEDPNAGPKDIMDLSDIAPKPGTPLAEVFGKDDITFEFDNKSLTHRPDLWGHHGIAREVAVITGGKFTALDPKVTIPKDGEKLEVKVEDQELCPRYCGLIIDNIKVEESPDWLKKRLQATGHGTHNNIVDITNYIMHELGQPLHAFDKNFIEGGIVVRRANKGEKITTLDDKKRTLSDKMLVIADHKKPVAIAGVMGGKNSEINEKTTSIIIESANFNAASVRKTSTKLGLRTDAVQRFEKSLDPYLAEMAILRAAELVLKVCPDAKIGGPLTDVKTKLPTPPQIVLDPERINSKIGIEISTKEITKILESLEFTVKTTSDSKNGTEKLQITVPTFRATKDIETEDDIVEEVARIHGYDSLPATLPALPTRLPAQHPERFKKHRTRELFSYGLGFHEVMNYSFYSLQDLKNALLPEEPHLQILNYLSEDQTHMRITLIPNLLKTLHKNLKNQPAIRVYEIGRTYKEINEFFPLEEKHIAAAILGTENPFLEAKGAANAFFKKHKITAKSAKGTQAAPYAHPQKSLTYLDHNGETIGRVFVPHPQVLKNYDLKGQNIAMLEINLTESFQIAPKQTKFQPLPKFPSIELDISILTDAHTEAAALQNAITSAEPELIKSAELFDIYQGEHVPEDKKALAYKVTLQAPDRTLTDVEMTSTQQKIFKNIEKTGSSIRGQ